MKSKLQQLKEIDYLISYCVEMQNDIWKLHEADKLSKENHRIKHETFQSWKNQLYAKKSPLLGKLFLDYNIIIE